MSSWQKNDFSFKPQSPLRQKACLREEQLTQVLTEGGIMCFWADWPGNGPSETASKWRSAPRRAHNVSSAGAEDRRTAGPRYSGFMNILILNGKKRKTTKKHTRFVVLRLNRKPVLESLKCVALRRTRSWIYWI